MLSLHTLKPLVTNASWLGWRSRWEGCSYWSHGRPGAWWNVTNDPVDEAGGESPLWAFTRHRALNRLALRTKLRVVDGGSTGGEAGGGADVP